MKTRKKQSTKEIAKRTKNF